MQLYFFINSYNWITVYINELKIYLALKSLEHGFREKNGLTQAAVLVFTLYLAASRQPHHWHRARPVGGGRFSRRDVRCERIADARDHSCCHAGLSRQSWP